MYILLGRKRYINIFLSWKVTMFFILFTTTFCWKKIITILKYIEQIIIPLHMIYKYMHTHTHTN